MGLISTEMKTIQKLHELEDRLTQLNMDSDSLRLKQEKLTSDKNVVLKEWAEIFVATLSEEKKCKLYDALALDLDRVDRYTR